MSDTNSYESIFRSDLFSGKAYVITGGGSGIGLKLAKELKSLGARVALIGRDADKLERVREGDQAGTDGHGYPQGAAA